MLSRVNRLSEAKSFAEVKSKGVVFQSDSFGMAVYKREDEEAAKFGFVVSNKIAKLATQRNWAKRIMREAIRERLGEIKEGYNIVFLAKQKLLVKKPENIAKEINDSLVKAKLIK